MKAPPRTVAPSSFPSRSTLALCALLVYACGSADLPELPPIPEAQLERVLPVIREQILTAHREVVQDPSNSQKNGRLAMILAAYGFNERSSTVYRRARLLEPGNAQWAYFHGHLLAGTGHPKEATEALRTALGRKPDLLDAKVKLAELRRESGAVEESGALYEEVLASHPRHILARYGYGQLLVQQKQLPQAAEQFRRALEIDNRIGEIHYALAMVCRRQGDNAAAQEHLAAFERTKGTPIAAYDPVVAALSRLHLGDHPHMLRAKALFDSGRYADAFLELNRALAINPDNIDAHAHLIWLCGRLGDYAKAEEHYRRGIEIVPNDVRVLYNWGSLERRRGRYREAREALEKVLDLDAGHARAHAELGYVLEQLDEPEAAAEHYRRSLALEPDNQDARTLLDRLLARMGRRGGNP